MKQFCIHCHHYITLSEERASAKRKMQENADKMCEASVKRFKPAEIGDTVLVPVPDVDRGRGDFPNVMGIVLDAEPNGLYKVGTKSGILQQKYSRNQFQPCRQKFISTDDVPTNCISLREAARVTSNGTGQGFFKCSCNPKQDQGSKAPSASSFHQVNKNFDLHHCVQRL